MSQGLTIYDASGNPTFSTSDRLGRVIYKGPLNTSGVPNQVWTQVVSTTLASQLWAIAMPNYAFDSLPNNELYYKEVKVSLDPTGQPGCIFVSGTWYDSMTSTTSTYPYDNSILIYGLY